MLRCVSESDDGMTTIESKTGMKYTGAGKKRDKKRVKTNAMRGNYFI